MFQRHENFDRQHPASEHDISARLVFCGLIDELEDISLSRHPDYFLIKLQQLRTDARACRLHALVAVTEQCLRGLGRAIEPGQHARFSRDYAALMRDAVDCGQATQAESEALLASAAYRIFG